MEETRLERKIRYAKRAISFDGGSLKGRLDIPKKRFSNQVPTKFPKDHDEWCLTQSLKREEVLSH